MKVKVYMRVAKSTGSKGYKVAASIRPNYKPLMRGSWEDKPQPTAAFALLLDIPEEVFHHAEQVMADLELRADDVRVAAEVAEED